MKARSAKNKGRRLQNIIVEHLLKAFPSLTDDDVVSVPSGVSGRDIMLSAAAQKQIPYSIEAKNREKLNIWSALQQAEDNAKGLTPVVIFKRNRSKTYAVIELDEFIKLIKDK